MKTAHHDSEASVGRIIKYTGLFGGVQGFYALMGIVRNKITALLLKASGMGLIDYYARTADLIGSATNLGLAFSAVPRIARLHGEGEAAELRRQVKLTRSWVLITALVGMLLTAVPAPLWSTMIWGDGSHTVDFLLLAPMVFFTAVTGGETAILKGLRCLKSIALISVLGAVTTLAITTCAYFMLGTRGIAPALTCSAAALCYMQWRAAHRYVRYEVTFRDRAFLKKGLDMVRLGLSYAAAGFVAAGGEYAARLILLHARAPQGIEGMAVSGIYAAGFTLTVTYARLIFTAMDADYFPRLSAAVGDRAVQNRTVNRQIDVLVQLTTPMLPVFCLLAPLAVKLLFSADFAPAVLMLEAAIPYLFFKAVCTPVAYLALAHTHSRLYLAVESSYSLVLVVAMAVCYPLLGMKGAGLALLLSHAGYLLVVVAVYRRAFGFSFAPETLRRCRVQLVLLILGFAALQLSSESVRWAGGLVSSALSMGYAWKFWTGNTAIRSRMAHLLRRKK